MRGSGISKDCPSNLVTLSDLYICRADPSTHASEKLPVGKKNLHSAYIPRTCMHTAWRIARLARTWALTNRFSHYQDCRHTAEGTGHTGARGLRGPHELQPHPPLAAALCVAANSAGLPLVPCPWPARICTREWHAEVGCHVNRQVFTLTGQCSLMIAGGAILPL